MTKNKKILLILGGIIIVILIGFVLSNQQSRLTQQSSLTQEEKATSSDQEYPDYLLEGRIKTIDIENKTLNLEVKASLIKTAKSDLMEKTIRFTEDTICAIYQMATKEETLCGFSEIKVDDSVLIATLESTYEEINTLEEFTATKITKMVGEVIIPDFNNQN